MLYDGHFVKDSIRYMKLCNFLLMYRFGRAMILLNEERSNIDCN